MATNFPTSLDSYTDVADGDTIQISTTNNQQDAIEALEAKVGVDSSAVTSSHDYKIGAIETILGSASTADLTKLHGVTSTADELNILHGVTATKDELNILDGVTADKDELNILDGVTATADELNKLDGVTGSTAEINAAVDAIKAATTTGDLLVKGSSSIERLAAVAATQYLKSAGTSTKPAYSKLSLADTGVAIGSFATGFNHTASIGFEPSAVIFLAAMDSAEKMSISIGIDDGTTSRCIQMYHDSSVIRSAPQNICSVCVANYPSGSPAYSIGDITETSSTGFTFTWSANNVFATVYYLALP